MAPSQDTEEDASYGSDSGSDYDPEDDDEEQHEDEEEQEEEFFGGEALLGCMVCAHAA
jgi:hypothetical protein